MLARMGHDDSSIDVEMPVDGDGYLSQACPKCEQRFKVVPDDLSGATVSFCPYCAHRGKKWFTSEQNAHIQALVRNHAQQKDNFTTIAPDGVIAESKINLPVPVPPLPQEPDEPSRRVRFACCRLTIKCEATNALYCVICGTLHPTSRQPR
ncbi:MAG: hypothetical protein QM783_01580 [Phycisphaerales bacterium]